QDDVHGARASIRRALVEVTEPLDRVPLLFAAVQILLAGDDREAAREASGELDEIAAHHDSALLAAQAGEARGAVALADGETATALVALREAWQHWQDLGAPYEAARVRVLVGLSCRYLGDDDAARLELEAARGVFAELGATTDLTRVDRLLVGPTTRLYGLTPREMEILRMVAGGQTNKRIAAELVLSERTVDRHVSNILTKLGVPSRTGATAYAYEHGLL
ncbi:MAG: response regulator transcription factor, partial [Actinomycetota bacterium]|nr:response regulator transcription factor [Actinomycetota bacterium]